MAPIGRDRKNMTFNANLLLHVRLSKISLFCKKVGKGLFRSLYQVPFTHLNGFRLGTEGRYSVTNGKMFLRIFCSFSVVPTCFR